MPAIFILFVVIAIAASIYSAIAAKKRREDMAALAARLGLSFCPGEDYSMAERFSFLTELAQGSNRYAFNVLSGRYQDKDVLAFDYHYETYYYDKNGRHTTHYYFSFLLLTLPLPFPELKIRHEGLLSKIAQAFGYDDINFESAEFSKAFCVHSPDKKFAYDFCNARMIEYLLDNRDVSIEVEQNALALVFNGQLAVEKFELDLQRLEEIRSRMPEYLFDAK